MSQRNQGGYFMLDHSQTEGLDAATERAAGLPPGAGQGLFESSTYTCTHCQTVVLMNPARRRERSYCTGCDHYICDGCGAVRALSGRCRTVAQILDEAMEQASRQPVPSILLP